MIKSGFKSRAGYDGAGTVIIFQVDCRTFKNSTQKKKHPASSNVPMHPKFPKITFAISYFLMTLCHSGTDPWKETIVISARW